MPTDRLSSMTIRTPICISTRMGRRLITAFGNLDGNFKMLQPVTMSDARLGLIVRRTDASREYTVRDRQRIDAAHFSRPIAPMC